MAGRVSAALHGVQWVSTGALFDQLEQSGGEAEPPFEARAQQRQQGRRQEHDRWVEPRRPIYVLEGLHCSGARIGETGPCDLACSLLWHEDWLLVEPAGAPGPR